MKTFQVKVYDENDVYLTTWSDIVSDIQFNNEINSAGGQLTITLARDAGDYGEGSDIDFNYKIKVYVYDLEQPTGLLLFQGFISGYTPIYKNNNVVVTVLSYGAELNSYLIEGGELLSLSQTTNTSYQSWGNAGSPSTYINVAQTFTATETATISRIALRANTLPLYNSFTGQDDETIDQDIYCVVRAGTTPESGTILGTSRYTRITDGVERPYSMIFDTPFAITNTSTYNVVFYPVTPCVGADRQHLAIRIGSGYAGGSQQYSMV